MNNIDKFINKLKKKKGKLLNIENLKSIGKEILKDDFSEKKVYKIIYNLKNKGYLISIKKDIFYITSPDEYISLEEIIERFYWKLLKLHLKNYLKEKTWYIAGLKALQIHNYDFSIPDTIYIGNFVKNSKEVLAKGKYVYFKKYKTNDKKFISLIKKNIEKEKINGQIFNIASLELALLESVYSPPEEDKKTIYEIVKKTLKKKKKSINRDNIIQLLKHGKFHSSINKLAILAKQVDYKLYEKIFNIIKKYSYQIEIDL